MKKRMDRVGELPEIIRRERLPQGTFASLAVYAINLVAQIDAEEIRWTASGSALDCNRTRVNRKHGGDIEHFPWGCQRGLLICDDRPANHKRTAYSSDFLSNSSEPISTLDFKGSRVVRQILRPLIARGRIPVVAGNQPPPPRWVQNA